MIGSEQIDLALMQVPHDREKDEYLDPSERIDLVTNMWHRSASSWSPSAYSMLLFRFGHIVRSNPQVKPKVERLLEILEASFVSAISNMSSPELSQLIRGYASMECTNLAILEAWDNRVIDFCSLHKFDAIASIIALANIKAAHVKCLGKLWRLFVEDAHTLSAITLTQVAHSAAVLHCKRTDVKRQLRLEVEKRSAIAISNRSNLHSIGQLPGGRIIQLLWALAILCIKVNQSLANQMFAKLSREDLTQEGMFALHQASLLLGVEIPAAFKRYIDIALATHACDNGITPNRSEAEIASILTSFGLHPIPQWPFDGYYADIALIDPRGAHPILFEFDGPYHTLANGEPIARDRAKNEVALRRGFRLVRIASNEWDGLSCKQRASFLQSKVT